MYKILEKTQFSEKVFKFRIEAPAIAKHAHAGQFLMVRANETGERVPFTLAGWNGDEGWVEFIFMVIGKTTEMLSTYEAGESLRDVVGPLGVPTEMAEGPCAVIGGGVGLAIAFPVAKHLVETGHEVHAIMGARTKDLLLMEDQFRELLDEDHIHITTDDGSYGEHGFVTVKLQQLLESGIQYDEVLAIGPIPMMKFVSKTTEPYGIPTTVSMSPIMVDGTGMCGGCRLTVGGETKFACVDGPDFDGHKVDWDESLKRGKMYFDWERHKYEETCNLFSKEVQ